MPKGGPELSGNSPEYRADPETWDEIVRMADAILNSPDAEKRAGGMTHAHWESEMFPRNFVLVRKPDENRLYYYLRFPKQFSNQSYIDHPVFVFRPDSLRITAFMGEAVTMYADESSGGYFLEQAEIDLRMFLASHPATRNL